MLGMVKFKVELIKKFNIVKQDKPQDPAILEQREAFDEKKQHHGDKA